MNHRVGFLAVSAGTLIAALAAMSAARADTITIGPTKDNTLYEYVAADGDRSNGAGSYFFVGRTDEPRLRRGLLRFDIAGSLPAGSTITGVTLRLNMSRTKASGQSVTLHRLLADWGEGASNADNQEGQGAPAATSDATWRHRFYSATMWTTQGGEFTATASAATPVGNNGVYTWSSAGMVADAQFWLSNPSSNFGWLLKGNESTNKTAKRFDSRENGTPANRPALTLIFTPPVTTGACCLAGGACSISNQTNCQVQGGTWQGSATVCSPNPCALPTGACCFASGACSVLTFSACSTQGGTYQGDGGACSPNPCPQPTGACCFTNGTCSERTQSACGSSGGNYAGDGVSCATAQCPVVLTPFVDPLPIPGVATPVSGVPGGTATYEIAMREFTQRFHRDLPLTRVWGYDNFTPGPVIEASVGQPVTVTWINDLRDASGNFRTQHYLPVDTCMHGPDTAGPTPRTVVHLHGGHVPAEADGYPEDTFLPGQEATYVYPNNQLPGTLWFHDHALGITRLNVYMGLAGLYLLRDAFENSLGLPSGANEIPLVVQDRKFRSDGSLDYPATWVEHFFGDKILVNGKVWPYLEVERGKYRFRLLNGSTSRTYRFYLSSGTPLTQIGTDGGLLPVPVTVNEIALGPGERADVIVDFQPFTAGTEILLLNNAPAPFPGDPGAGVVPNVMKFIVVPQTGHTAPIPGSLRPIERLQESSAIVTRSFELKKFTEACAGSIWLINGLLWHDITEYPELDTTEIWSFVNRSGIAHPMHMHLVMFQILDRQPFTVIDNQIVPTGSRTPPPAHEAGWKDTVQASPQEITRVIARFESYKGKFPYHCHILEHEDHEMMRQFQTVRCGDRVLDPSEECDDGNQAAGDACSPRCETESFVRLAGTAQGGSVELRLYGVTITVPTSAGQSAAEVAAALAAAINADPTLAAMGVTALARGGDVITSGPITTVTIGDAGLRDQLALSLHPQGLWWGTISGATAYDVVRGDLGTLISAGGNFTTAMLECLANDTASTSIPHAAAPTTGGGWWFLARRAAPSPPGSYDTGSPSQSGSRDAEIAAAAAACP